MLLQSCEQHARAESLLDAPPSRVLGEPGAIRPRALHARTLCRSAALRLLTIRRGATQVHRQQLRTDGDAVNPSHRCATLQIVPGSWPPGRARSAPFAAPAVRLADDTPAYIRAQHEETLDKAYVITSSCVKANPCFL